jgi:DNA-directed RNA polymerase specialized sigma24 family protein
MQRNVGIVNTDPEIIAAALDACTMLGIDPARYDRDRLADAVTPVRKHQWEVRISRRPDLERLAEHVHLQAPSKALCLAEMVASYDPEPPWREVLSLREKGLTYKQIADELGESISNVGYWIRRGQPPRAGRPRS